jgi:periplasmic protein TonB
MPVSTSSAALFHPQSQQRALLACVAASVALHAAVLLGVPQWRSRAPGVEPQKVLTATLGSSSIPLQPAEKRAPVAKPARSKPDPRLALARPAPTPPAADPGPSAAGAVQSASAAPELPPAAPVQAPAAVAAEGSPQSSPEPMDGRMLQEYRLGLMASARQFKRYPSQAMERGWEGRVEVRITVRPTGAIESASIKTRSGYQILDDQALEMVRRAQSRTPIPPSLRGREFSVDIPVIFELQSG